MIDTMTDRVRKLFAKAESTTSEHEADALLSKAYDLLAKYGIDEAVAKAGAGTDSSEIGQWTFEPRGAYKYDQIILVNQIANSLHCSAIRLNKSVLRVYGAKRHLDRVELLAGMLVAYMLATAGKATAPVGIRTVTYRKSVMMGFIVTVTDRLVESERGATQATADSTGTEIVLASDSRRAAAALAQDYPSTSRGGAARRSQAGFDAGAAAASNIDLGGQRVGGRHAISA